MHWIDWTIVFALIIALIVTLVYCQKFVKSAADFLAANRCAGRYLTTITGGIASIGAISIIGGFEQYYVSGFSPLFWGWLSAPVGLIITITGWVGYRRRETRCLTMAQFFEVRYSRGFRILAGIMGWVSGVLNYGIFPAVSVKFFIYFCKLPDTFHIPGIPFAFSTYVCLLAFAISMGVAFAIFGGQIAVMLTDFVQGMFCNIAFLILMAYLVLRFKWDKIFATLTQYSIDHPHQSMFDPFDTTKIKSFNIWFFLVGIILTFLISGTWQGSSGYAASSKSPHEGKMGGLLGVWRTLVQSALLIFIPICAIVFFNHPDFAADAATVSAEIKSLSDVTQQSQATVPMFLTYVLPVGLVGVFAAVMFAAMLSTDDTYMHSWGTIFVQDVILPIWNKPIDKKTHIRLMQWSIVFVGVFAFFFSWLFKQTDKIYLFFAITGAIFTGGAGAVMIGGLYSKSGTNKGAWVTMILGSTLAIGSIVLQQVWTDFAPWMAGKFDGTWLNGFGQWFAANKDEWPFNNQILSLVFTIIGYGTYFIVSWIDIWINKLPLFNLEKMLHRGIYDTAHEHKEAWSPSKFWKLLGLTKEFTKWDRVIFFASFTWNMVWFLVFIAGTIGHYVIGWEPTGWLRLWKFYILLLFGVGSVTTFWFVIGGIFDLKDLFHTLETVERNDADNGMVIDGQNAGE